MKVEDATIQEPFKNRVFVIKGTERELDRLCTALSNFLDGHAKLADKQILRDFHHSLESSCCW